MRGNDIENMIKRRITLSSKMNKRLSYNDNDNCKPKKSSKTFLSGEYNKESYDEGHLFIDDTKIDIEGNFGTKEKETLFEVQENHLENEKDYNSSVSKHNRISNVLKEKDENMFNSVEHDSKSRSDSKCFYYFINWFWKFVLFLCFIGNLIIKLLIKNQYFLPTKFICRWN